ncbi:sulfite exporter TauE/SafE family protein [Rubrobacter taiwanensis]|uniref:Probable membrane transporter protein n=1 Tax=Rubrobacter taiwanensis TaxID=185139 RepID=A0A4R1BQJ3_9ACTN|nr:sulfite exporter TauE/SafE family protein [Rubrobacter taiwanensis]TCJ20009.1 sulfite exporter TauE/SafE family protein [Rubrobacter taiwanensis]
MQNFILLALMGLIAQLVDGSLGMAYGVTSTTLLLSLGITPALASASVHIAEVGTTFASGVSHWKFGNVDWVKVGWMAVPGGIGAFFGAAVLTSVSAEAAAPLVAIFLFCLGAYILVRFSFRRRERPVVVKPIARRFLAPLGFGAGFLDAAGGGGWGPISTPTLLSSGRMEPRKVVGTVDTSEFVVASAASVGFLLALSFTEVPWNIVGALLAGGVVAAPVAAWVVRVLPARILGTAVGGIILLTNARTFMSAVGIEGIAADLVYAAIAAVWLAALVHAVLVNRRAAAT